MNYLKETKGNPYEVDGIKYQCVWAAFPGGYNKSYPGFSFLQGFRNLETRRMEETVFALHIFPNGECTGPSLPVGKERLSHIEIDWDSGIASEKA